MWPRRARARAEPQPGGAGRPELRTDCARGSGLVSALMWPLQAGVRGLTLVALCTGLAGLIVDCLIVGVWGTGVAHGVPGSLAAAHHPTTCDRAQHVGGSPGPACGHSQATSMDCTDPGSLLRTGPAQAQARPSRAAPSVLLSGHHTWVCVTSPLGVPHLEATHLAGTLDSTCGHWDRCFRHSSAQP